MIERTSPVRRRARTTGPSETVKDVGVSQGAERMLEVANLCVDIRRGGTAASVIDDVSFVVDRGSTTAIVGESGAGKSVTTRAILDLLDPVRFEIGGTVKLDGKEVRRLGRRQRRGYISSVASLVFQDPMRSLNPTMRVGAQIVEGMRYGGRSINRSRADMKQHAVNLMRDVGIADPEERFYAYPHQLSGGMRQRIVIAIALSCEPKIVFCDEPTSSLDVTTQAQIMDLLDALRTSRGLSMVLITHDLSLAASRADEVVVMYQGRVVERLSSGKLSTDAAMPYTQALLKSMPSGEDGTLPDPLPSLPYRIGASELGCPYRPLCPRAKTRCGEETPELATVGAGHAVRCFFPEEGV